MPTPLASELSALPAWPALVATAEPARVPSPPVRLHVILTGWQTEPLALLALAVTVAIGAAYLAGARRLARRSRAQAAARAISHPASGAGPRTWSRWRSASFLAGLAVIVVAVNSGVAAYDDSVFAMHVVQHLLLMSLAPPLLALGAPVTLALQASSRPVKTRILKVLHSPPVRVVSNPMVAFGIGMGTMYAYFLTPIYDFAVTHPLFHDYTHLHFLVAGCLFWWPIVSADPMPRRLGFGPRLAMLGAAIPFTAFLGMAITSMSQPIAPVHTLADTHAGGAILWISDELLTIIGLLIVLPQWIKAEERQAARDDRRLDLAPPSPAVAAAQAAARASAQAAAARASGRAPAP